MLMLTIFYDTDGYHGRAFWHKKTITTVIHEFTAAAFSACSYSF